MDEGQFKAVARLLMEIRDRLPERVEAKPASVAEITEIMTDAIRLQRVRELAERWLADSNPDVKYCGRWLRDVLDGEE